jgi:hypothetical protein
VKRRFIPLTRVASFQARLQHSHAQFADREIQAFLRDTTRPASRQHLVFEGLLNSAVQAPGVTVDNRNVPAIPIGLFEAGKIDKCGPFQESGPIGVHPVNPVEEVGRKCD